MILLVGVAGSGKSMQGRLLADKNGYAWISTGEVLRVLITGKRRQEMLQGKLLANEEVIKVVDTIFNLINPSEEFVMDGFPRTEFQADWLLMQEKLGRLKVSKVFNLVVDEQTVRDRLTKRNRPDDTEEAIARRFEEFANVTQPIISYMRERGVPVIDIDATVTPAEVHGQIISQL